MWLKVNKIQKLKKNEQKRAHKKLPQRVYI